MVCCWLLSTLLFFPGVPESPFQLRGAEHACSQSRHLDVNHYRSKVPHHPVAAGNRAFGARRLPIDFHTIVDPDKHPKQPWRDLPPPTGASPFHLDLATILAPESIASINQSGKLVFHAVGDTGGVNTPTQIENVETYMESDFPIPTSLPIRRFSITWAMSCITTENWPTTFRSSMSRT